MRTSVVNTPDTLCPRGFEGISMATFPDRMRQLRVGLGLTQEALGIRVGVTKATVSGWETGRNYPEFPLLPKLRKALGLSYEGIGTLVCGDAKQQTIIRGIHVVMEDGSGYSADVSRAKDSKELALLMRYRAMAPSRRTALLDLLKPGE